MMIVKFETSALESEIPGFDAIRPFRRDIFGAHY
jgi:hypothetical protein